ncbi:MAG: hypothetical protein AB1466_04445 [Actinomycetota bacterium]
MALTMKEKRVVTREVAARYQRATKSKKRLILDEFVKLIGEITLYSVFKVSPGSSRASS